MAVFLAVTGRRGGHGEARTRSLQPVDKAVQTHHTWRGRFMLVAVVIHVAAHGPRLELLLVMWKSGPLAWLASRTCFIVMYLLRGSSGAFSP